MKIKPMPPAVRAWLESEGHKGASVFKARSGQVSRAFKDKPSLVPSLDEKGLIFDLMMKPTPLLKFGRSGAPHWRNFSLSADRRRIVWTSPNKRSGESQVLVSEIKYVENSMRSKVFERHKKKDLKDLGAVSLSIFYAPHGKAQQMTLDVMCKHPDVLRVWACGIDMLVKDYEAASAQERRAQASVAASASGGGGAAEGNDDDDDDDGGDDAQNLITGSCKAYTWGVGGWGQLGRPAGGGDYLGGEEEPKAESDGKVAVMAQPVGSAVKSKKAKALDVRKASCGGSQTVVITRGEGALVCGRSFVCCDSVGQSVREHFQMPVMATAGALAEPFPQLPGAPLNQPGVTMGTHLRQVSCGESHTLFLTFTGDVFASGSNFFGQLGDGTSVDHSTVKRVDSAGWAKTCPRGAIAVAAGFACSAAVVLTAGGNTELFTWGANDFGVLGLGQGAVGGPDVLTPTKVPLYDEVSNPSAPPTSMKITQIECGGWHMACLVEQNATLNVSSGAAIASQEVALGHRAASASVSGAGAGAVAAASSAPGGGGGASGQEASIDRTRLLTWGCGACGQLGHGVFSDQPAPLTIAMLTNGKEVASVACGASHMAVVLDITSGGRRIKGQLWTWGNGAAATGSNGAAHSAMPRAYNLTKKGNQNNVAVEVQCGDNFTAVLDEDANVTVIGVSPVTGNCMQNALELPKEDEFKNPLDVESMAAGGTHLCLVMAERTVV